MKLKTIKISFIAVIALVSSCTDLDDTFYDRIPADTYPENDVQAALMTTPVYAPMRDFLDWGGWYFAQEVTSDEITVPTRDTDWDDGGKWRVLHTHQWNNNTAAIVNMWPRFYKGIFEANALIERTEPGLNSSDAGAVDAAKNLIAKMKIMRAYYYYLLIDNYGDVPFVTSFAGAPEMPYKEDRATIFDAIVEDVEVSISDLGVSNTKTGVSKGMAFSLLAKLYLNSEVYTGVEAWSEAEAACDSVIALGQYSLEGSPLAPFITENSTSPENIWVIPYDEDTYKGFNIHMRTLHYNSDKTFDMVAGPWNGWCVVEEFYNSYSDDDARKEAFLVGQQYTSSGAEIVDATAGTNLVFTPEIPALHMDASYTLEQIRMSGVRFVKFEVKSGAKGDLSNDFPIFRYADILLMKAETMIRQDKNGDEYVNMIHARSGLEDFSGTTLEMLLAERGREMFSEGHRRQDLIRFGEFNKAWWEKDVSSTDRNVFPIPQNQIDVNPNLAN